MKLFSILCFLLVGIGAYAQAFSFVDTSTTLVKTTDQSPAHWYIEVFNDVNLDTTLRWKMWLGPNVPAQWEITFDDGNNFHQPVNDGDSADFTLYAAPTFPQKLIIGAILNNTAGTGSVYFDIYDPANPSYIQTIEYHFIISMGSGTWGTEELSEEEQWFAQSGNTFTFPEEFNGTDLMFYDSSGKRVHSCSIESNTAIVPSLTRGIYFIRMNHGKTFYSSRVVLN